tara:strand:+ start:266 stop:499 length:234 start_codon:yes stop_codon:yes gene_type:complete
MQWLNSFEEEAAKILAGDKWEIALMTIPVMDSDEYETHHLINIWDRDGFLIKSYLITQDNWKNDLETIRSVKKNLLK